ncbi:CehA/McbA family metallohydrolase [Pseudomonas sp. CGJS7]|uniref:CehA/McbA family metallohydrolase n=1 Tax=Pseudomonas sp. CGJS7 TaxID=3109348 RepID=UPI003008C2F4
MLSLLALAGASSATAAGSKSQAKTHAEVATATDADPRADIVLRGQITGRDNKTYRELPFQVPAGTTRITIEFDYDRADKTTIDLGLIGPGDFLAPHGFRGWSGGNKRVFTVGANDATPSYSPGALPAGEWKVLLGIPNIRAERSASYTARIHLGRSGMPDALDAALAGEPLRAQAGWYRGDLHMHSAHSDGGCAAQSGAKAPCPLFLTAQAAAKQGLDFIAVTEHNTVSHLPDLRALQPHFDRLLLIPGIEITTFQGHANVFGTYAPVDFRVGSAAVPDWNAVLRAIEARRTPSGAPLVSINHPIRPSDERCMGCGWTPTPAADLSRVQMVEVVNGGDADTPGSGIGFWQRELNAGHRLTGVGGSDNHDALTEAEEPFGASRIGRPTTVVRARELSMPAILEGLRAGNAFVDVRGSRDRGLDLQARHGGREIAMGGELQVPAGAEVELSAQVGNVVGGRIEAIVDGAVVALIAQPQVTDAQQRFDFRWRSDGARHWLRVDVRDAQGRLALVGNPIYLNPGAAKPR